MNAQNLSHDSLVECMDVKSSLSFTRTDHMYHFYFDKFELQWTAKVSSFPFGTLVQKRVSSRITTEKLEGSPGDL